MKSELVVDHREVAPSCTCSSDQYISNIQTVVIATSIAACPPVGLLCSAILPYPPVVPITKRKLILIVSTFVLVNFYRSAVIVRRNSVRDNRLKLQPIVEMVIRLENQNNN